MPIQKQTLKYFFGATNTDASKKGVRVGDLIEASNVRQVNAGEYVQRGGLLVDKTQTYERYGATGFEAISVESPDGAQLITRVSDGRAYASVDGENHRFMGSIPMLQANVAMRSPAVASGENIQPLAKRAGQYSVHFVKDDVFEVTKSDVSGSGIVERHRISMQAGNLSVSKGCKSLAIISSDDFDSTALWVFWTDWDAVASTIQNPGAVYARKIPYDDLDGGSAYVAHVFTGSGTTKGIYLTSVSASVVGAGECAVAFCGFDSHDAGNEPLPWWIMEFGSLNKGPCLWGHFYLDKTTGQAKVSPAPVEHATVDNRTLVGSGCCILTAKGIHEYTAGHWFYAFWTSGDTSSDAAGTIAVVDVTGATLASSISYMPGETLPTTFVYPLEPGLNGATFRWHWLGSITGHETASGIDLVASCRTYWFYGWEGSLPGQSTPATPSPDLITTRRITKIGATWSTVWTARASWLACGYFRDPNDTEDLVVTGYSDRTEVLPTYHIRRVEDGAIVAQIAYGQATKAGGVAVSDKHTRWYISDVQQPMLYGGATKHVVLGLQSDNTAGAVDIAEVTTEVPATWQQPAIVGRDVFYPGPMATTCGGWRELSEAAPLLSPGEPQCFYWDSGLAVPITDGTITIAVVYRFVYSNGGESRIARSAPTILNNALRAPVTGNPYDFVKIPTLRHLTGAVNALQLVVPSGQQPKAQIELYLDTGDGNPQLWAVYDNDPTVDYIEADVTDVDGKSFSRLLDAIAAHEPSEVLYTMGDALEYSPPPMARAVCQWRNRLFAVHENTIAPTQEFVAGFAPSWNETLFSTWTDGTGGILAICPIDQNYLAVFKRDAIGILSGPGPDGVGRGAYVVQTLPTYKGVTNPRSVINGADGCYFQDAATGRICLITPQLQIVECAPGAWHLSGQQITCALHVEFERQVWFATENAKIIVIDYKHRTEACPFGFVYTWDASVIGYPRSMCLVGGSPKMARQGGSLANYSLSTGYDADTYAATTKTPISMIFETGEMQVDNLQGEFALSRFAVLGEYVSPHVLTMTIYPSYSASGTSVSTTVTAGPEQFVTRPPNCSRIQSVRARLVSVSSATVNGSPVYGQALKFIGFALEVQPRGRIAWQPTSRVL